MLCLSCKLCSYSDHPCLSSGGGHHRGLYRASWAGSGAGRRRHCGFPLSLIEMPVALALVGFTNRESCLAFLVVGKWGLPRKARFPMSKQGKESVSVNLYL